MFSGLNTGLSATISTYLTVNKENHNFFFSIELSDFTKAAAIGAAFGIVLHAFSEFVDYVFTSKTIKMLGSNISNNNAVNKKLVSLGLKDVKMGKIGFEEVKKRVFKKYHYNIVYRVLTILFDCRLGSIPF